MSSSGGKYADYSGFALREELSAIRNAKRNAEREHNRQKRIGDPESRDTYTHIRQLYADEREVRDEMDYRSAERERREEEREERERKREEARLAREEAKLRPGKQAARQTEHSRPRQVRQGQRAQDEAPSQATFTNRGDDAPSPEPHFEALDRLNRGFRSWLQAVGHPGVPSPRLEAVLTWTMRGQKYHGLFDSETGNLAAFMEVPEQTAGAFLRGATRTGSLFLTRRPSFARSKRPQQEVRLKHEHA